MRIFFLLCLVFIALCHSASIAQCINTTSFGTATVSSCSNGTISTCNYALEYGEITFNITGAYIFNSSISTDYLTLTTSANLVIASGPAPLTATVPSSGLYRLHVNTNASCGTQSNCRITTYACGTVTPSGGCINTTQYGNAIINSCSSGTISNCNWALEYSDLTFNTTGSFVFSSSIATDFLTFTDGFNNIIAYGTQPLVANVPSLGSYRLHVSKNAACATEQVCRVTSYDCNLPCSGTPAAGSTQANSSTICSASTINFNLAGVTTANGLTYLWQTSPNASVWTSVSTATNSTYVQSVSTTGYFRCIVACGSFTSASSPVLITLGGTPVGGTTMGSNPVPCGGGYVTYNLSGASTYNGLMYQWQSSANGTVWTNIPGKTLSSTTEFVSSSTYFRCILSCGTSTVTSSSLYTAALSGGVIYATTPYYQTFDNAWQNGCDIGDVPDNIYWKNNPTSGNNSWRRQDDGNSASWANAGLGVVIPASGIGCADFHSSTSVNNSKGELTFYVNMNQNGKYALSFYYLNVSGTDKLDVMLSTDAGNSYSIKGNYTTQSSWTKKTIYFNSPNSATCVIKLRGTADNGNDDIGIDSLSFKLICLNPNVTAVASTSVICAGQSLTLTASGATNYTWTPSGIQTAVAVVTPTVNTHYVVKGTNDGLCFPTADVLVTVVSCNGIEEFYGSIISVYPNPAEDSITISLANQIATTYCEILDAFGKIVWKENLKQEKTVINIEQLTAGLYFYKVYQNGFNTGVGKLIKQ